MFNKEDRDHYLKLKDYLIRGTFPLKAEEIHSFDKALAWVVALGKKMNEVDNEVRELKAKLKELKPEEEATE